MTSLRVGVLGAARIAPAALIKPARSIDTVSIAAIAARDPLRAHAFARKHRIPRVHATYADLIADPELDAIYNPLPNGLHAEWTLAALAAGKHVLCEKPFTANAAQAATVAQAAGDAVVMEAFHYRYHPMAARMAEIVHSGEIGDIESVQTAMCFPLPKFSDIRYSYALAGGALMDAGCYALHCLRLLGPGEPTVTDARALTLRSDPRVDRAMVVELSFPNGATGRAQTSMWSSTLLRISATVKGSRGSLAVTNFVAPQFPHRFTVTVGDRKRHERFSRTPTYTYQLAAFAAAVGGAREANLTPPEDSIATMKLIDASYWAAGLPPRG
ncbi:Gfo/Idh/MocA family protein [Rhizocola hellebori]|uniref:Gfo/Idh/MocA family protein n=1 Tax=Rhizocola hellebori TaxID=1392758 RepID=UPI0019425629|nr:Gfo/Idh/MocA family oxidoreductase [Rhizocola hellebori]